MTSTPLSPSTVLLGKYQVRRLIGRGAFGEVYEAVDTSVNAVRAIKRLRRDIHLDPATRSQLIERFQLEGRIGARFEHPNIIRVYTAGSEGEEHFVVMEYAPGGSLETRIEQAKDSGEFLPVETVLQWARDIAAGLGQLHRLSFVHRDLKPGNLLFGQDGHIKVSDLSVAQVPGAGSYGSYMGHSTRNHPGTPEYQPSEQYGHPESETLTPAADIYAAGCVLFELLTNQMYAHCKGKQVKSLRKDVPVWLNTLVSRMLANDPKNRPQNGIELLQELHKGFPKRRSLIIGWIAGAAVVISAGILAFTLPGRPFGMVAQSVAMPTDPDTTIAVTRTPPTIAPASTNTLEPSFSPSPSLTSRPLFTSTPSSTNRTSPTVIVTKTTKPTVSSCTQIGQTQVSNIDSMTQVCVPAGEFGMGSSKASRTNINVLWPHNVYLDAFWIDQTEVTNKMYQECVAKGRCTTPGNKSSSTRESYYSNSQYSDYPVIWVDWNQAKAYCQWAGRSLPTEAQWEKSARGTDGRIYPWGNIDPDQKLLNYVMNIGDTSETGNYPEGASPFGALDMAGNVWEWVADWFSETYYQSSPDHNPTGPEEGQFKILRGGGWGVDSTIVSVATRYWYLPQIRHDNMGFRCAQSAASP